MDVPVGAGETARSARTALIDHDEIARSPHPREGGVDGSRGGGRRHTGTAFEIEQRTRRRLRRRRQHRDSQVDRPPLQLPWIRRDGHVAAPTVEVAAVGAGAKLRRSARRSPPVRPPEKPDDNADGGYRRDRDKQPHPARQTAAGRPAILTPVAYKRTIRADALHGPSTRSIALRGLLPSRVRSSH